MDGNVDEQYSCWGNIISKLFGRSFICIPDYDPSCQFLVCIATRFIVLLVTSNDKQDSKQSNKPVNRDTGKDS